MCGVAFLSVSREDASDMKVEEILALTHVFFFFFFFSRFQLTRIILALILRKTNNMADFDREADGKLEAFELGQEF